MHGAAKLVGQAHWLARLGNTVLQRLTIDALLRAAVAEIVETSHRRCLGVLGVQHCT
jgi:hypothetical protein